MVGNFSVIFFNFITFCCSSKMRLTQPYVNFMLQSLCVRICAEIEKEWHGEKKNGWIKHYGLSENKHIKSSSCRKKNIIQFSLSVSQYRCQRSNYLNLFYKYNIILSRCRSLFYCCFCFCCRHHWECQETEISMKRAMLE